MTEFNKRQFAWLVTKMASLREGDGTLLDNCIMMWGSGLEDGNVHTRENLPFVIAGKGGGSIRTGRYLANTKGNQGDLLTTLLACAGVPNGLWGSRRSGSRNSRLRGARILGTKNAITVNDQTGLA